MGQTGVLVLLLFASAELFLNRKLLLPVSKIWQWWVRRSSSAVVILVSPNTLGVQRLVALLVPAITVVMGAAIAGIVASLLLAMLGLNDLAAG